MIDLAQCFSRIPRGASIIAVLSLLQGAVSAAEPEVAHPVVPAFDRFSNELSDETLGRVLLSELGCLRCHQGSIGPGKAGPNLGEVAERIQGPYLRDFLAEPHAVKPGTTMPSLFHGWDDAAKADAIEALTHFLAARSKPFSVPKSSSPKSQVETGKDLYHTVGCVACHKTFADPPQHAASFVSGERARQGDADEVDSVPLGPLSAKTDQKQLRAFLLDPLTVRPDGRMPDMKLSREEADAIASYLMAETAITQNSPRGERASHRFEVDPQKARQGGRLFSRLGCAACHSVNEPLPEIEAQLQASPLRALDPEVRRGCLNKVPSKKHPFYPFSQEQRAALLAVLNEPDPPAPLDNPSESVRQILLRFNCYACHKRNGLGGPLQNRQAYFSGSGPADLGDEGRLPPPLDGVGAKLKASWLEKLWKGGGEARPYVETRMPHFGRENLGHLTDALTEADPPLKEVEINVSGKLHHHRNRYGRRLVGTKGLNCITCHNLNGHRSLGIPGIDLALTSKRLRPEWFKAFLLDPGEFRAQIRMPAFFSDGKSPIQSVLGGDVDRQIEAIWVYLREVEQTRLPLGMEKKEQFIITPEDRPIVHRTFMKGIGTHAIAVGYPQGVHVAFDARGVRFALAWRGRFLNGESAWANRFTPFVEPLGQDRYPFPPGVPFAALEGPAAPWPDAVGPQAGYEMRGFELMADETPIFKYSFNGISVRDRVEPSSSEHELQRKIEIRGDRDNIWFRAAVGERVVRRGVNRFRVDASLEIEFPTLPNEQPRIRSVAGRQELLVPVPLENNRALIKMEWTW